MAFQYVCEQSCPPLAGQALSSGPQRARGWGPPGGLPSLAEQHHHSEGWWWLTHVREGEVEGGEERGGRRGNTEKEALITKPLRII